VVAVGTEKKPTGLNEAADQSASTDNQWLHDSSAMIQPISNRLQHHVFSKSIRLQMHNIQKTQTLLKHNCAV